MATECIPMYSPVLCAKQQTSVRPQRVKQVVHWSASLFLGSGTPEATADFFKQAVSKRINFVKPCVPSLGCQSCVLKTRGAAMSFFDLIVLRT